MKLAKYSVMAGAALLQSCLVFSGQAAAEKAPAASEIVVKQSADAASINPMLLGSQFNYFSPPIRQRLTSEPLLKSWRDLPVKLLRYPGGTWADHYCWDNPAGSYFVVGDANSVVTPEQFMKVCRDIGAEPIFQVNTGSKGGSNNNRINPTKLADIKAGARTAANWVRDANINRKWGIKYWEIGNEVWIWLRPEEYAQYVVEYSKAMKAADPSIKIIACGLSGKVGPFDAPWLTFKDDPDWKPRVGVVNDDDSWNQALFTIAKGAFDYVAPHPYLTPKDYVGVSNKEAAAKVAQNPLPHYLLTVAAVWDREPLLKQQGLFKKYDSTARLAVTEWACNFGHSVPGSNSWTPGLYFYSFGNALNHAHYFGRIAEGAAVTDMALLHSIEDIQALYYWPKKQLASGEPLENPSYFAMKVWGTHLGTKMLQTQTEKVVPLKINEKEYPSLYAYGSEDSGAVYVVAINLDPEQSREVVLNASNIKGLGDKAAVSWLTGPSIGADNFVAWEGEAPLPVKITEEAVAVVNGKCTVKMPPHSMLGLTIKKM